MICKNIDANKNRIMDLFNNSSDLIYLEFESLSGKKVLIVYISGLIDKNALDEYVVKPLIKKVFSPFNMESASYTSKVKEVKKINDVINEIVGGHVALFFEDVANCYIFNFSKYETRAVERPQNEQVVKGPKEAFVEDIFTNKSLIRRKIRNNNLVFEDYTFGHVTNTQVSLVYINGIVNEEVLEELKKRLERIEIDGIFDTNYIEEYIKDKPSWLIRTVNDTEKPDVLAAKILEGRVGILCDGSPNCLFLPTIFIENLMTAEDYYITPVFATFLRTTRLLAFILSTSVAGLYVALGNYHQEMIPTKLLITMAGQREGVPLPAFIEAIMMILFFEFLKEAGLRLPQPIGSTVTIVGGLVLGQAAVDAGIVSSAMIIIVSIAGITEFVNPHLTELVVIYRFIFLILGGIFGLFGIASGLISLTYMLINIKSFGVPFLYPLAPYDKEGMKDFIIRNPLVKFNYRPKYIASKDSRKRK